MAFVGIPTYNGQLHYSTVKGLLNAALLAGKHGIQFAVEIIPHDAFIGKARSIIAHKFLASGFQDLIFIDADVGFNAQGFVQLCKTDVDVAMGLYRMKEHQPIACSRFPALIKNPIEVNEKDENLVELEYGPAGFLKIRRNVFETMMEKYPEEWWVDSKLGKVFDFFPHGRYNHDFVGEDISFCNRLKACGFRIWGVQGIELDHYGESHWHSDWRVLQPNVSQAA